MAVNYLHVSAFVTVLSFSALHWWASGLLQKFAVDGVLADGAANWDNAHLLKVLWKSNVMVALVVNFFLNVFVFAILCLKTLFFVQLYPTEIRKMLERLFNYIIYKGAFLPLVVPSNVLHVGLWSTWLITLSSFKMFQTLAKDRLERLNASPSATYGIYFRVFSALLFVLVGDILWICLCMVTCGAAPTSMFMLLLCEPLSIAFETMQAIIVHGFQLLEMWHHCSLDNDADCHSSRFSYKSAASLCEWKTVLNRNFGFLLDTMTLLMAAGHYLIIWWLHGISFHLVDAILFMNLRALVSAIIKRIRGFIKLQNALASLNSALHDATSEELNAYNDDCAICREPMSKAKKLSCNHLFHLPCLRSWLDQGISEVYSCPTCRRSLFPSTSVTNSTGHAAEVQHIEQYDSQREIQQQVPNHTTPIRTLPTHEQNPSDSTWRGSELDATWAPWTNPVVDIAGTSAAASSGSLNRVQVMMRHLASVGESYAHGALEDSTWNLWPPHQRSGPSVSSHHRNTSGLRLRSNSPPIVPNMSDILLMAERVREILPHIPDELIIQDLQRTNNATTTVNNFLPT